MTLEVGQVWESRKPWDPASGPSVLYVLEVLHKWPTMTLCLCLSGYGEGRVAKWTVCDRDYVRLA